MGAELSQIPEFQQSHLSLYIISKSIWTVTIAIKQTKSTPDII